MPLRRTYWLVKQLALVLVPLVLFLVLDVLLDHPLIRPHRAHAVTAWPERPAEQSPMGLHHIPMDTNRTLSPQIPDRHRNAELGALYAYRWDGESQLSNDNFVTVNAK